MPWTHIRLELARTEEHPDGSNAHGYDLVAPLDETGHLVEDKWRTDKKKARVHRFWEGEADEVGQLILTRHRTWAFSYAPGEDDDEPIFHLETHKLKPGEYITISEEGEPMPFRVVASKALSD
ncbi:MAG: hypothetical protein AAF216_05185 [Pseudomonadota bacterium]